MKDEIRKAGRVAALVATPLTVNQQKFTRRAGNALLLVSILALVASEDHARRTWRDRAGEAEVALIRVQLQSSYYKLPPVEMGMKEVK